MSHHLHPHIALALAHLRSADLRTAMHAGRRSSVARDWLLRSRRAH